MNMKDQIIRRMSLIYAITLGLAALVAIRVLYLQLIAHDRLEKEATDYGFEELPATRGNIYSADGKILALSVPYYTVALDFGSQSFDSAEYVAKADSLALCLAGLFKDKPASEYRSFLDETFRQKKMYRLFRKEVTFTQKEAMEQFPVFRKGQYKGGFIAVPVSVRKKPYGMLMARTLGYVTEGGDMVGLEKSYDYALRGRQGKVYVQRLAGGDYIPLYNKAYEEPEEGRDILTTIDYSIQESTERELLKALKKNDALFGTAIVMEVNTGHIKAIANIGKNPKTGRYDEIYNFAVGERLSPGSTFKLPALMAAFEDGLIGENTYVNTRDGTRKYSRDFTMKDSHKGGYGVITVKRAFELSSNVGISSAIYDNYASNPQRFIDRLCDMRLNKPVNPDLDGEQYPYLLSPRSDEWSQTSLPQMSIGYEVQISPLQLLTFYNAVANNGVMVAPMFVKEIRKYTHSEQVFHTKVLKSSICSKETLAKARRLLEGVVQNGTAENIYTPKYRIAGKTGTAIITENERGYKKDEKRYRGSFVGYFPADKPRYSCLVMIAASGRGVYYGNEIAAPVFRAIADKIYFTDVAMHPEINIASTSRTIKTPDTQAGNRYDFDIIFDYLGIPVLKCSNTYKYIITRPGENKVVYEPRSIKKNKVPNVVGMGARDAVFLIEKAGYKAELSGRGRVKSQNPGANIETKKGQKIILTLG